MNVSVTALGLVGALLGAVLGFAGSLVATIYGSRGTNKEIFTRTVTDERAEWRRDLREVTADFVSTALRVVAEGEKISHVYDLERLRVQIRLRLNPNIEDSRHQLDADILRTLPHVVSLAHARDLPKLRDSLEFLERCIQRLLKQEWEKSKSEAQSGQIEPEPR